MDSYFSLSMLMMKERATTEVPVTHRRNVLLNSQKTRPTPAIVPPTDKHIPSKPTKVNIMKTLGRSSIDPHIGTVFVGWSIGWSVGW